MIKWFKLTKDQWKILASALSNIGQGVILFSFAAIFVPEVVSLSNNFPKQSGIETLMGGLILLLCAIIMSREKK